jgi:hypothetical protein
VNTPGGDQEEKQMKLPDFLKRPVVVGLVGVLVGLIVGLIWAWMIQPVVWTDVPPTQLGAAYQEHYLRMAIDSYQLKADDTVAMDRFHSLGKAGPNLLQTIQANPGTQDPTSITKFASVVQAESTGSTPATGGGQTASSKGSFTSILIIIAAVILFALVGFGILRYLLPLFRNTRSATPSAATRARDFTNQTEVTDYEAMGQEPPISQFVTTYVLGDDLFDDSFSIDSPSGEFLGECGIGISETIGVGDPKKVQAFEVWLFDKNDIQTVTKVLMSVHAYNDVATFQRLQAKGEPFMVERGKQVVLETAALQLVATVSDAEYGQGALPDESYFDRLTLEIAVWPKLAVPAAA